MILMPSFSRDKMRNEWSVLVPCWSYEGRGYDICSDEYKYGPWRFAVRFTLKKEYGTLSLRISWGSTYRVR